jgi:hypothetical protein
MCCYLRDSADSSDVSDQPKLVQAKKEVANFEERFETAFSDEHTMTGEQLLSDWMENFYANSEPTRRNIAAEIPKDHSHHRQIGRFPTPQFHLLKSILVRPLSKLGRTEALELRLLLARCSDGSVGRRPLDLAKRLSTSVMDTTPVKRPDRREPGKPPGTTVPKFWPGSGDCGVDVLPVGGRMTVPSGGGLAGWMGWRSGVAGALGEGEADSTTHLRWDLVATSLATVWPSVE